MVLAAAQLQAACGPVVITRSVPRRQIFSVNARKPRQAARASPSQTVVAGPPSLFHYTELQLETKPGIHIVDITPQASR